jgi:hypothetical protein
MSLTMQARRLYPGNRRMAARWVLAQRYIKARGIVIRPWWGNSPPADIQRTTVAST